jgi:hypothetical protein
LSVADVRRDPAFAPPLQPDLPESDPAYLSYEPTHQKKKSMDDMTNIGLNIHSDMLCDVSRKKK